MRLSCQDTRRYLLAHLASELDPKSALDVQDHLETCQDCATEAEALAKEGAALRRALASEPVEVGGLERRITRALAQVQRAERLAERPWPLRRPSLALAAALLVSVVGYALLALHNPAASALAERHYACASERADAEGLSLAEARAALAASRVPEQRLVDLRGAGWRFLGGHRCKVQGQHFLHAYYERSGKRVSVFVALDSPARELVEGMDEAREDGIWLIPVSKRQGVAVALPEAAADGPSLLGAIRASLGQVG